MADTKRVLTYAAIGLVGYFLLENLGIVARPGTAAPAAASAPSMGGVPFVPGVRYVAKRPDGTFEVVVNGQLRGVFPTQTEAERYYNQIAAGS